MTPEDRALARQSLLDNRLSIEQVTDIQKECEASGKSFRQVAVARGLLKAEQPAPVAVPRPPPASAKATAGEPAPVAASPAPSPFFQRLLIATLALLLLLVGVSILRYLKRSARDQQLAEESIKSQAEADRLAKAAAIAYSRDQLEKKEQEYKAALARARELLKLAEEGIQKAASEPQIHLQVVEATVQFNAYLAGHEEDAAVYLERSRAYEIRRDFERALKDVDRALELNKELAPAVHDRQQLLRLQVARPRK